MNNAAKEALLKEIVRLRKKLLFLEQDRTYHKSSGERLDASIDEHESDLADLLSAYEQLGGSPDETIPG